MIPRTFSPRRFIVETRITNDTAKRGYGFYDQLAKGYEALTQ